MPDGSHHLEFEWPYSSCLSMLNQEMHVIAESCISIWSSRLVLTILCDDPQEVLNIEDLSVACLCV